MAIGCAPFSTLPTSRGFLISVLVTLIGYEYGYRYMVTKRKLRTFRCAYCGDEFSIPSTRGPVPTYCSPAHRQAAYRERHLEESQARPGQPSLRENVEALRMAVQRASNTKSWAEARQILAEVDSDDGRSTT